MQYEIKLARLFDDQYRRYLLFRSIPESPPARTVLDEIQAMLINKHHDYGEDNLRRFGVFGILVRLADKFSRLDNLIHQDILVEDESIDKTWFDVIGYAAQATLIYGEKAPISEIALDAWQQVEVYAAEVFAHYQVFPSPTAALIISWSDYIIYSLDAIVQATPVE